MGTGAAVMDHCAVALIVSSSSSHRSPQVYLGCLARGSSILPLGLAVSLTMVLAAVHADMLVSALGRTLGALTRIPFVTWFIVLIPRLLAGLGPYIS